MVLSFGSNAGAFGSVATSICFLRCASSACAFCCCSLNLSASASALSSSSIARSLSFSRSASSYARTASSSRFLLASHFFMPPSPAYGFVPLTPSRSFILILPFPFLRSRSRSCMRVIGRLFLDIKVSGIGAPLRREGRSGVLYTSSSCRAFSAGLIGQRWGADISVMDPVPNRTDPRRTGEWVCLR